MTALQELLGPEQMLRVQAPHRGTVLGAVHQYSHQDKATGSYCLPEASALLKKVVVVTLTPTPTPTPTLTLTLTLPPTP